MVPSVNLANKHKYIIKLLKSHIIQLEFLYAKYKDRSYKQELNDSRELLEYIETLWGEDNK